MSQEIKDYKNSNCKKEANSYISRNDDHEKMFYLRYY